LFVFVRLRDLRATGARDLRATRGLWNKLAPSFVWARFFEKQLGACGGLGFFVFAFFERKNACGGLFFLVCTLRLTKSGVYGGLF
jgi:hypothetical protein